jgi:C4-type Zn-finger protein
MFIPQPGQQGFLIHKIYPRMVFVTVNVDCPACNGGGAATIEAQHGSVYPRIVCQCGYNETDTTVKNHELKQKIFQHLADSEANLQ